MGYSRTRPVSKAKDSRLDNVSSGHLILVGLDLPGSCFAGHLHGSNSDLPDPAIDQSHVLEVRVQLVQILIRCPAIGTHLRNTITGSRHQHL